MDYSGTNEKKWLFMNIINGISDDFIISKGVFDQKGEIEYNANENVSNEEMFQNSNLNLNIIKDLNETLSSDDRDYKTSCTQKNECKPYITYKPTEENEEKTGLIIDKIQKDVDALNVSIVDKIGAIIDERLAALKRRIVALLILCTTAGCALWSILSKLSALILRKADRGKRRRYN